jgi:hypothetical protein
MFYFVIWSSIQNWTNYFNVNIANICIDISTRVIHNTIRVFSIIEMKFNQLKNNCIYITKGGIYYETNVSNYGVLQRTHYNAMNGTWDTVIVKEYAKRFDNYKLSNIHFVSIIYQYGGNQYPINLKTPINYYIVGNVFDNTLFAHYLRYDYSKLEKINLNLGTLTILDDKCKLIQVPFNCPFKIIIGENDYECNIIDGNVTES